VPERAELGERLDAVLAVVYLVFSEGYAATSGDSWIRRDLSTEAIRLGRLLERLLPERSEPVALVALMLLHDARRDARVDAHGDLVLLEEQDRSRWDQPQIAEGCERVERALRQGGPTPYALQAAIAALHAQAKTAAATDWPQIVLLYRELLKQLPSAVVQLNHAAAVAMAEGAEKGLELLGSLAPLESCKLTNPSSRRAPSCSGASAGSPLRCRITSAASSLPRTSPKSATWRDGSPKRAAEPETRQTPDKARCRGRATLVA